MRKWVPLLLVLLMLALSAAAYPRLPESVPTHWGMDGRPDGWSSRPVAALLLPGIALGAWLLLRWLPSIDPRGANYARFAGSYALIIEAILGLLLLVHGVTLAAALGWPVPVARLVPLGVGAVIVVVGNVFPRLRPNFFFGLRTPWTLSSDRVWERTHRVGGYLMVAAGLLSMIGAFLPPQVGAAVLLASVLGAAIGSGAYSYVAWRREARGRGGEA